jgi:hypothetical protein
MDIWAKFDQMVDTEGLKKDVKEVAENKIEFKEVPEGRYEVKIEKIELRQSKTGRPMVAFWFKVLEGEYENQYIFWNQVVDMGFGLHKVNEFLRSLDSGLEVQFENFTQYGQLLMDIHEAIDGRLEYGLKYSKNNKGYDEFEITDVFELE